MAPPANSALLWCLAPKILPIFAPKREIAKVTAPISVVAYQILTSRKAKVTPTARASIEVARDKINMVRQAREVSAAA